MISTTAGAGCATTGWVAGAVSEQHADGNAMLEYSCQRGSTAVIGLAVGDSSQAYSDIDCALYSTSSGALYMYSLGVSAGSTGHTYTNSDVLKVQRIGTSVTYWKGSTKIGTCSRRKKGRK